MVCAYFTVRADLLLMIEQLPKVLSLMPFCSTAQYDIISVGVQSTFMAFLIMNFAKSCKCC